MTPFGQILFFLLLPALAVASPPALNCAQDPKSEVFEEYKSLSDEEIGERCTYDIQKHEPDADEKRVKANVRRTSICEKGLNRMREISQRYVAKRQEVCQRAQNAPTCADTTSQTNCVVDAAKLAEEVRRGEEELSAIMGEGKEKLSSVARFNRLLTARFNHQQRELGMMPVDKKNRLLPTPKAINNGPENIRPLPGKVDQPIVQTSPESSISSPAMPPPTTEIPRTSGISNPSAPAYEPPAEMRPQDYGARSWAEYERKLPFLMQQNENTTKQLKKFEEVRVVRHTEHRVASSKMAVKAAEFFAAAEKMGYAGEDLTEWKKENPALAKNAVAQAEPIAPKRSELLVEEEAQSEHKQAPIAVSESKKDADAKALSRQLASADPVAEPSEEAALSSFESKLADPSQSPAVVAERSRLRDLLKRRMEAMKNGQLPDGLEKVPGSLVGDILAETNAKLNRNPDSQSGEKKEIGTVDVEGALRDIEAQLRELDRQSGILEATSVSLFERVKAPLKKFVKSQK